MVLLYESSDSPSYRIAEYICSHLSEMKNMTASQIVQECYCSPSALSKVIHFTGASSWGRFKERLLRSSKTRYEQLKKKLEPLNTDLIVQKISCLSECSFDASQLLEESEAFASVLIHYRRLNIFGSAFPLSLSMSFAEDLCLLGVFVCPRSLTFKADDIHEMAPGCAITFSGRWLESSPESFSEFRQKSDPFLAISMRNSVLRESGAGILMPHSDSTELDNCIYLLILDLILLQVFQKKDSIPL